jgi:two-component system chemotaxis response regulator CheY
MIGSPLARMSHGGHAGIFRLPFPCHTEYYIANSLPFCLIGCNVWEEEDPMLKKVLIIDDSALIHQIHRMVLMRYNSEIIDAYNGQEGIEKLAQNPDTDLILLDINMPAMNGLDFIRKVKEIGTYGHIPIIIVSTEGKEEDTVRGLSLGAKGYVKKPFQPSDLYTIIQAVCPN